MSSTCSVPNRAALAALLWSVGILVGCGSGDSAGPPPGQGSGAVDSLVLSLDSADVIVGDTLRLTAVARDANGQPVPGVALVWTSTDPSVATVDPDGLVTAVDVGEADIEVDIAGASAVRPVTNSADLTLAELGRNRGRSKMHVIIKPKVTITPGDRDADVNETIPYTVRVTDARGRDVANWTATEWSSFDVSVATIDPVTGVAITRGEGTTQINAAVTVRGQRNTGTVVLRVLPCAGVLAVAAWDADLNVSYNVQGGKAAANATFSISQGSGAKAHLVPVDSTPGISKEWAVSPTAGSLTGVGNMNNTENLGGRGGVSVKETAVPPGTLINFPDGHPVALFVFKLGNSCRFLLDYRERAAYKIERTLQDPEFVSDRDFGRAKVLDVLGPKPSGGWVIAETDRSLPIIYDVSGNSDQTGYFPGTGVGIQVAMPKGLFAGQAGTATFRYSLTAR